MNPEAVSVIIPAFNEEEGLLHVLKEIHAVMQREKFTYEIVVVDDGSTDKTAPLATSFGDRLIRHPENIGYGASLQTGILAASYDWIMIMDGDGSYDASAIPRLLSHLGEYHMVVGARQGRIYTGSFLNAGARWMFRFLTEFATGRSIPDVNSGFRAFRKDVAVRFFDILSHGFSFTTTITLASMLSGYFVKYVPVDYYDRKGKSKISRFRDSLRALQIIISAILYYNPLKLFLLPSGFLTILAMGFVFLSVAVKSTVLLLCGVVSLVGAILVFALGLVADVIRRSKVPRDCGILH